MLAGNTPLVSIKLALLLNLDALGWVPFPASCGSWKPKNCIPGVGSTTVTVTWPLVPVFVVVSMVVVAV